jgi:hypothetical protein
MKSSKKILKKANNTTGVKIISWKEIRAIRGKF